MSAEVEAGVSGLQESFNKDDSIVEGDETRMEDDKREFKFVEGEMESTERVAKGKTVDEKKIKERERMKEREREEEEKEHRRNRI